MFTLESYLVTCVLFLFFSFFFFFLSRDIFDLEKKVRLFSFFNNLFRFMVSVTMSVAA